MRKSILISIFSICFAVILFAGGFVLGISFSNGSFLSGIRKPAFEISDTFSEETTGSQIPASPGKASIEEALKLISANSINIKSESELVDAAIEGMISSLDDNYADYFAPLEYKQIIDAYSGTMSGVGIVITMDEKDANKVFIVNVIEGTPAFEKGLLKDDIIIAVDGIDITGKSLDEVVAMIKGEENTEVKLTVLRPSENKKYDFEIIRKRFYVPNFYVNTIEKNILYIQYMDFQDKGAIKLNEKLQQVANGNGEKIEGIIVDLRNNLGGTLNDAVEFCDLFLDEGLIVSVKGRTENKEMVEKYMANKGGYTEIPVVVLINEYSASASELAAGALKDLKRAVLVGKKSFGKGTVQALNELPNGSGIKFTTAKYYLPSGITIDGTGIEPDIAVDLTIEDTEDVQFIRALEEIKKMIESN